MKIWLWIFCYCRYLMRFSIWIDGHDLWFLRNTTTHFSAVYGGRYILEHLQNPPESTKLIGSLRYRASVGHPWTPPVIPAGMSVRFTPPWSVLDRFVQDNSTHGYPYY